MMLHLEPIHANYRTYQLIEIIKLQFFSMKTSSFVQMLMSSNTQAHNIIIEKHNHKTHNHTLKSFSR